MKPSRRLQFVVGALGAVVAMVACQEVTSPHRAKPDQRGSAVAGSGASRSTINSPDSRTVHFDSVQYFHGNSVATDTVTYPYTTIVMMTARGVIYTVTDYPIWDFLYWYPNGRQFSPASDMTLQTTVTSIGFGGGSDSTVLYRTFAAGERVTGGLRSLKDQYYGGSYCPVSINPCNNAQRLYCGPSPACIHYGGDPGSVTLERVNSDMVLTVDSTSVSTGSHVKFMVRPDATTIVGLTTPYQIDTAAWTPDADSLGGDFTEAVSTGACTISGGDCTRTMVGSGTVRIVAHINGKGYEGTVHVAVSDAFPKLVVSKNPAYPYSQVSDSVTFTASMSDASATTVTGWAWAQDSGSTATSGSCAGSHNPCKEAVRETGTMTVAVTYKGTTKHARAHVDLIKCPTRDDMLDNSGVRAALKDLMGQSNPDATPGTGQKKERASYIVKRADGTFYTAQADSTSDECSIDATKLRRPDFLQAGDTILAIAHTHPVKPGKPMYGDCGTRDQHGNPTYSKRFPADSGSLAKAAKEKDFGGGSNGDWTMTTRQWNSVERLHEPTVYTVTATGEVWQLPSGWGPFRWPDSADEREFKWKGSSNSACNW